MNWKLLFQQLGVFFSFAALVVFLGQMTFEIPGTRGVESNFAEVALMLSIPFLPRWWTAFLLSLFTYFNAFPEPSHFPETLNHVICFPLVWMAYNHSQKIRSAPYYILYWGTIILAYYFIGLIPLIFLSHYATGQIGFHEALQQIWTVSQKVVYEVLVTSFVSVFYFLMIRELGIRKAAQEDLLRQNREMARQKSLLQAQFDATQEGILVVSPKGKIVSWNRRFLEIWQIPSDSMDKNWNAIPSEAFSNSQSDTPTPSQQSDPSIVEVVENHQDSISLGDGRSIDRFTAPIHGENNEFFGRVWFFRDITRLKKAEIERENLQRQFYQSQKMEAVGQLAGGVAHDFNNSLAAIMGAADLASMENIEIEEQREYLRMILTAAKRAGDLTRKLLAFSRKGTKEMSLLDAGAVVNDTVGLLRRTIDKRISIVIENNAENTLVDGDDGLLQNAFMNLGINASHAMQDGGTITFTLANTELAEEYCASSTFDLRPGPYLTISVRDTGCGMPFEIVTRIFEPFFTTKKEGEGTGLGLAAVYGTLQDHHGAITVYSEVGAGTIFHVHLPLSEQTDAPRSVMETPIRNGTGTILLIDDEDPIRATTKAILTKNGYTVEVAANGRDGFDVFLLSQGKFDLVILDLIMPHRGGRETFTKIREIDPNIPVILSSGFSKEEDLQAMREKGISGFLQKPFGRTVLLDTVAKALGNS
jgi:signal transduction histidine kinase/ActR/RegA family two-component response regulator